LLFRGWTHAWNRLDNQEANNLHAGRAADATFYIQEGKVRLTVVSSSGKEATLGIMSVGDFFGSVILRVEAMPRKEKITLAKKC